MRRERRGKLFWRKVSPGPLSKDFWARGKDAVAGMFYRCDSLARGLYARRLEIPTCGRPPLRMTQRGGSGAPGGSVLGDWRSRPMVALRVRLRASPSAQDDTEAEMFAQRLSFTLNFRRYFFSFKQIKKPSPAGEGGPRQWWMRSSRDRLTYTRHLIRQPAVATFSHWRRLSFVSALYVNKHCGGNHCIMVAPAVE